MICSLGTKWPASKLVFSRCQKPLMCISPSRGYGSVQITAPCPVRRSYGINVGTGPSPRLSPSALSACSSKTDIRLFSTRMHEEESEGEKQSNRAAFKAIPIIPSILRHIEKIGVGLRPKRPKHNRRKPSRRDKGSYSGTLDEHEESDFFAEHEAKHRLHWRDKQRGLRRDLNEGKGNGNNQRTTQKSDGSTKNETKENKGAYWLPPPPFSSFARNDKGVDDNVDNGRRIIRRPVKLLGRAGSLEDVLPRDSKGLSEVAIAGRSNVGKSTLLNALLYGNVDEKLSPRQYQRGRTPERAKLPKGIKAVASSKPGETKELR